MRPLRASLRRLLEAHEPNPALIVDGLWNLIEANRAASLLWDGVAPELLEPPVNVIRLGLHPDGLPRLASNAVAFSLHLLGRLERQLELNADDELGALLEEVRGYLLGLPSLSGETARQLRAIQDWRTTLPLPLPADKVRWRDATVNGGPALALVDSSGLNALLWQRDGRIYSVAGQRSADEILRVANGLR